MRGKILISLLALGATSAVFANGVIAPAPVVEPNYFDGFFLGLGAGLQHQTGDVKNSTVDTLYNYTSFTDPAVTNPTKLFDYTSNLDTDFGKTSFNGEIFGGYGKTFTKYYAGVELYARYADADPEAKYNWVTTPYGTTVDSIVPLTMLSANIASSVKVESDFSFGGALKLGYLITPKTMVYVLAGVEQTKFDVDVNNSLITSANVLSDIVFPNYSYDYSFDKSKWAFVPGVGLETMLSDKLSLSAQYTYADYGKISKHNDYSKLVAPVTQVRVTDYPYAGVSLADDKIDLSRGVFTLRLTYRFNGI